MRAPDAVKPATRPPKVKRGSGITVHRFFSGVTPPILETVKGISIQSYYTGSINNPRVAGDFTGHANMPGWTVHYFVTHTKENGHQHHARIFSPDAVLTPASKIIAECECPYWCFYSEYAAYRRGAGPLYRCNGDPPSLTNPRLKLNGGCKHLLAAARYLSTKPRVRRMG